MRTISIFLVLVLVTMASVITGCQKQDDGDTQQSLIEQQTLKEVLPVVQSFFNSQYDYAMGKDKIPQWDKYLVTSNGELQSQIDTYKDNLYYNSELLVHSYTSKVIFDQSGEQYAPIKSSLSLSGDILTLYNVMDESELIQVEKGESPNEESQFGGIYVYENIVMQKIEGIWRIKSFEEYGLMGNSYRWYINRERFITNPTLENELGVKATTTYKRNDAKAYALAHWNSPDSRYPDYTNYGGDCANFVSQCLEAGKWTQTDKSNGRSSYLSWYHDQGYTSPPALSKRSTSWTAASSLYSFLANSSRVVAASYPYTSMSVGDVIQLSNSIDGTHHSMIVTTRSVSSNGTVTIKVHYRNGNGAGYSPGQNINVNVFPSSETKKCFKLKDSY